MACPYRWESVLDPQRIGKYELTKFLGGGMSHVYMARDTLIGRRVAIKVLTEAGAKDESTKARFIREAQLAGNVVHDNIIRVYDFGEENERLFMVMEFLEGEDLCDALKRDHAGNTENRIRVAIQIARAMEHIHSLQIVHRDLKPQNVYITSNGTAKLMDFGIAKTDQTSMTRTGFTVGTPTYMAPEQVLGKPVNHLADIYAFGILLYELITGSRPLVGDTLERVFWLVLNEDVDLRPLRVAHAPEPLVELVRCCTQKNPASRPQSFTAVREQLEAMVRNDATKAMPTPPQPVAAKPYVANAAAAAPVAAVAPTSATDSRPTEVEQPKPASGIKKLIFALAGLVIVAFGIAAFLWMRPHNAPAAVVKAKSPATPAPPAATLSLPSGEMVLVSAGPFLFGENKEKRDTPAFYVDRTAVTNAGYGAFVKAVGYTAPPHFDTARPDYPVVNVTVRDAREFARWAGKRLPTSVEWEKAARGDDGRKFPWGDSDDPKLEAARRAGLQPADTAEGQSPFGARLMSGNIFELVDDSGKPSERAVKAFASLLSPKPTAEEPWCMIRGSSHVNKNLYPVYESGLIPERFRSDDIGFRCARDVQ